MMMVREQSILMMRMFTVATVLMAPVIAFAATRALDFTGVEHKVGLALLVTLQRGSGF